MKQCAETAKTDSTTRQDMKSNFLIDQSGMVSLGSPLYCVPSILAYHYKGDLGVIANYGSCTQELLKGIPSKALCNSNQKLDSYILLY